MSVGRVRPSVEALPAYRPGKAAVQAEAEHGISDAIKLASNENPYSPAPSVVQAITEAAAGVNRYPDHLAVELRSSIADWVGVEPEQVTAGCGSVGLLRQICMAYVDPGDEVVYPWLSFEAYPISVTTMGGVPVTVPLSDNAFDLDAVAEAVTDKTKMILLATPNNPTGTAVSTAAIRGLLNRISDDIVVLVDEAYREFADPTLGDPVHELIPDHPNVVVFRTFSKAYGLAGLRVGYAVADPEVVSEIDKTLLAFAVNGAAQAAAMAALSSLEEIQTKIDQILAERTRVVASLSDAGWKLPPAHANFVYLATGQQTDEICLALEKRGVVVRPFSGDGIRVTIGSVAENDRFLSTLSEVANP